MKGQQANEGHNTTCNEEGRAVSKALEETPSQYLEELRALLKAAMTLKGVPMDAQEFARRRLALEHKAQELLSVPRGGLEEKVRMRFYQQQDHLFTFLDYAEVQATNNLAERQRRPAVIARKLSCGNKTSRGAAHLGNPGQLGRHLRPTRRILRQNGQPSRFALPNALNRYPRRGRGKLARIFHSWKEFGCSRRTFSQFGPFS